MALQPFTAVEDGIAILRIRGGMQKQAKIYHRGGKLFVQMGSAFARIIPTRFDDAWSTVHPDAKVLEIEGEGISINGRELEFKP